MVAGVIAGFAVHPIIIGMVLAAAGNAYLVRRAFNKTDWLNEPLLDGGSGNLSRTRTTKTGRPRAALLALENEVARR
jgi:hypothetical protein